MTNASPLPAALLAATAIWPASGLAQSSNWAPFAYGTGAVSVQIPFQNASTFLDPTTAHSPQINLSFPGSGSPGSVQSFTMDTGSVGIALTPAQLGVQSGSALAQQIANSPTGTITYSSSGRILQGNWFTTTVNLLNGGDPNATTPLATATVPVLVVSSIACIRNARDCTASSTPPSDGVYMMGVGFGRTADLQPYGTPDKNPLINITQLGQTLLSAGGVTFNPGYVVSSAGVTVGLTAANTAGATFTKLLPYPNVAGDWTQAPVGVRVTSPAGTSSSGAGVSLADTGVNSMFIVPPAGASTLSQIVNGVTSSYFANNTNIALSLGAGGFAGYDFNVTTMQNSSGAFVNAGSGSSIAPSGVTIASTQGTFANTGRNVLNGFQVIFDPANGYIGYNASPGSTTIVTPGIALQGTVALPSTFGSSVPVALIGGTTLSTSGTALLLGGIVDGPSTPGQSLTLGGGGTFNLAGTGTYAGGTTVQGNTTLALTTGTEIGTGTLTLSAGALSAGASYALPNAVLLSGTGGTILPNGQTITLTGPISGAAGLAINGPGTVRLANGTNSYSGGTLVQGGAMLGISSDAQLGAPTGGLTLNGATLSALASFTSGRPITIGTSGATFDTGAGHVVTLTGTYTHNGPVTFQGTGEVVQGGTVISTDTVTSSAGTLTVQGTLGATQLNVSSGSTLAGSGTVAAPTTVSGTLSPGSSPGTLTFIAPVTLQPGATYLVDVDGPGTGSGTGNHDRVLVLGTDNTFTAAGTLAPRLRGISGDAANTFTPVLGQSFTVIQAGGGVLGQFDAVAQPAAAAQAGQRFDLLYSNTGVALVATPGFYANLGAAGVWQTANQASVGAALDAMRPAAGPRLDGEAAAIFGTLYPLGGGALPGVLDALSGSGYGDGLTARLETRRAIAGGIEEQLAAARGAAQVRPTAGIAEGERYSVWLRGLGAPAIRGGSGPAPGFSASSGGVQAGAETRLGSDWRGGLAVAFTNGMLGGRAGQKLEGEEVDVSVYAGWSGPGGLFLDIDAGAGLAREWSTRNLTAFGRTAKGAADGAAVGGGLRAGVTGDLAGWRLEPSLGLRAEQVIRDGLTETGAGALGLSVRGAELASLRSTLGVTLQRRFATAWDSISVTPRARLGWAHEFGDTAAITEANFIGAPGTPVQVASVRTGRDAALLGAGAALGVGRTLSVFVDYGAELRTHLTSQMISAGVRASF